ncbi:hypothetical protein [Yoonia vestfoldensis]|uniref:hypothetical protein n=1 Tax=Yoonia vestfoldensis TaxID=245188 RepID=UPI000B390769|nr:hypothetical protein [Yoonia vestfoldensis]
MRQLRDDTHLILDGEVRVYRRERSKRWQAAFNIDGHTIRISTGKRDVSEAKEYARDTFLEYKFRHKNDLPVVTKKFSDVAKLAIADMRKQLDAGLGRKVYADYIVCIVSGRWPSPSNRLSDLRFHVRWRSVQEFRDGDYVGVSPGLRGGHKDQRTATLAGRDKGADRC